MLVIVVGKVNGKFISLLINFFLGKWYFINIYVIIVLKIILIIFVVNVVLKFNLYDVIILEFVIVLIKLFYFIDVVFRKIIVNGKSIRIFV